ncbi:hypothetical protein KDH10_001268 [Shewanella vesiculosa]|nr:hypothetical protein [Shewanella vesiculosa]UJL43895.1 hypothetical protein KDH10_001268 [Shewanella vesiculosa]
MEFVKTIYPALATLIAALLVFVYSFVNLLVSKDQKITEFRQDWINSIREEIAYVVATLGFLATQAERYKKEENKEKFLENSLEQFHDMAQHFHKIQLRLNPKGKIEKQLLAKLTEIEDLIDSNKLNTDIAHEKSCDLISISQDFLKKEWNRVKRGELAFAIAKYSFLLAFLGIIGLIGGIFTGYIELSYLTQYIKA